MNLTEKASYIKGLAEGLALDETTREGKILAALLDLVDEMAQAISDVQKDIEEIDSDLQELNDYAEELDDDLNDVENCLDDLTDPDYSVHGDEDDEDQDDEEWDEDDACDGNCEGCDGCDDADYYEIVCPSCGETVCFDETLDPENLVCPACGEKFGCIVDEEDYKKIEKDEKDGK